MSTSNQIMRQLNLKYFAQYFIIVLSFFLFIQKPIFMLFNWDKAINCSILDVWEIYSHGLRLDIATTCYILCIPLLLCILELIWENTFGAIAWKIYNGIISMVLCLVTLADASLYEFWEFKLDSTVFMYLGDPKNATASVSVLYIILRLIAWILMSLALYWCLSHPKIAQRQGNKWWITLWYTFIGGLLFMGIRGLSVWPNNPGVAFYTKQMFCNHTALNPFFNVMYSITRRQSFAEEFHSMDDEECQAIFSSMFPTTGTLVDTLINTKRPDILVIVTEGMGANFIKSLTGRSKESVAICLDSLTHEGVNFTHCYGSSFRTDRGIVAALSGYPGQPTTSIMRYSSKVQSLPGLPAVLRKNGYETQVLYSSDVTFFNMSNYFLCCGHNRIISQDNFPITDRITKWGVPDHIAFNWLLNDMKQRYGKGTPQYTTMLTVSSHNPFDVPDFNRYKDLHLNAFAYTDSCIGRFVRELEKTKIWENLLLVITADHGYNCEPIASPTFAQIPLIMLGGVLKDHRQIETIMCQTDLPAILLGQLGLEHREFKFSRDVMANSYSDYVAFNTFNNGFTIFDKTGCTVYDNVAKRAIYGNDEIRIKRGKAFLQTLYNDLDKR